MENQNEQNVRDDVYSKRVRAGKRTYFFDVRSTRGNDYFITITESKKKFNEEGYIKHKIFLYKEDFNKFLSALNETVVHVKKELLPDYNFEEFDRIPQEETKGNSKTENQGEKEEVKSMESSDLKWE